MPKSLMLTDIDVGPKSKALALDVSVLMQGKLGHLDVSIRGDGITNVTSSFGRLGRTLACAFPQM